MRKRAMTTILALAMLLSVALPAQADDPCWGDAPNIKLGLQTGEYDLSVFAGTPIVLVFWAEW